MSKPSPKVSILARLARLSVQMKIIFEQVIAVSLTNPKFALRYLTAVHRLQFNFSKTKGLQELVKFLTGLFVKNSL